MRSLLPAVFGLVTLLTSTAAVSQVTPVSVPDESAGVVVSIAISAGILHPGEFPVAGRDCNAVLAELRSNERFAGQIRRSYEPPADSGLCFNLEGKESQVAVVCCAPRPEP